MSRMPLVPDVEKLVPVYVEEPLVTPDNAAAMLGVSRPTIYAWQDRGRLARVDHGKNRMVPMSDINRYKQESKERAEWRATIEATNLNDEAVDKAAATFAGALDLSKDADAASAHPHRTAC